jgi:hypothetical protein
MTDDEFDELCDRLIDKLGYDDPKAFIRELVERGRKHIEMTPAEMIALAGADISDIASQDGSGSITIPPDYPASREVIDAYAEGLRVDWRAGMRRALREWATEECVF